MFKVTFSERVDDGVSAAFNLVGQLAGCQQEELSSADL
jgi:hypothetical protein